MTMPQYTDWVVAPNPTDLSRTKPTLSWVVPPTPHEDVRVTSRTVTFQWRCNKADCVYKYKGSWATEWSDWNPSSVHVTPSLPNGTYSFAIQARDTYGNVSDTVTRNFVVYRELSIPEPISPAINQILSDTANVNFVCTVPPGEPGQQYHFEFQIAYNQAMTNLVQPNVQWFSSVNGFNDFSYNAPVAENAGGTITFTKTLTTRRRYWWRCRIRLYGTDRLSAASEAIPFTVGILGTRVALSVSPAAVRADGTSSTTVTGRVENALGQIDTVMVGQIRLSKTGVAAFAGTNPDGPITLSLNNGLVTTTLTSNTINPVNVVGEGSYLDGFGNSVALASGNAIVDFVHNRLPMAPTWLPESITEGINLGIISATATAVVMRIPADLDNDRLHMKIEIDTSDTFDSPNLIVSETRFNRTGWEYYDGVQWLLFPETGVPQAHANGLVRYTTTVPLEDNTTYYCRAAAWDNYAI